MEQFLQLTLLYDFYGELLTDKQRAVFEMSNFNDMSLAEIAEELAITPQGVRDFLKRAENILKEYESALELIKKHTDRKQTIEEISDMIEALSITPEEKSQIQNKLNELL